MEWFYFFKALRSLGSAACIYILLGLFDPDHATFNPDWEFAWLWTNQWVEVWFWVGFGSYLIGGALQVLLFGLQAQPSKERLRSGY